jgi:hypothetical protein
MEYSKPKIPPPTPEQWQRLPWYIKLRIILIIYWYAFVIQGLARLGLWLGGIKLPKDH